MMFIGAVETFDHSDRPPLVFHGGRYALTVRKESTRQPREDSAEPDSSFSQDFLIRLLGRAQFQLFMSLRRDLEQHGLSEAQWYALGILGVADARTVAELNRLLWHTGQRVTHELLAGIVAAGFAELRGYDPHVRVILTEAGRRALIELVAAAKARPRRMRREISALQRSALKRALRAIISETDPGAPPLLTANYPRVTQPRSITMTRWQAQAPGPS